MQIDIAKLNQIFGMQVDLCRYCGGTCEMSMRETSNREWGRGNREEVIGNREEVIGNREEDKSIPHSPFPIPYSQVIRAVIAQEPEGINFRSLMARSHLGISPPQMVWELRSLVESGVIVCKSDPKHKRRFLYFSVKQDATTT
ncbi:hypothetical protein [Chroococcidiopsis sp.]|uniref:hypothetical protein n=1 Tax=Chroococcidiopsis sp. TaxID=3088168 RepID=UPI003F38B1CC